MKNIGLKLLFVLIILLPACGNNNSGYINSNNKAESQDTVSNPVNNANPVPAVNSDSGRKANDTTMSDGSMAGSSTIKGESDLGTSQGNNVTGAPGTSRRNSSSRSDSSYSK
jgi:hypothetical protein